MVHNIGIKIESNQIFKRVMTALALKKLFTECRLLAEIILNVRNIRSSNSAFDVVMVAKGKYGGFLNRTSKIWDNAAQQILVEEAGGIYTDFFGEPIDYSNPLSKGKVNYTFCAAPPALHKQLQAIILEE